MTTRIMAGLLAVVLMLLQYRIWASPDGMREVWRLEQAIEERARTDLGMVKTNETFFQVVPPAQPGTATPSLPAAATTGQRTAQADLP